VAQSIDKKKSFTSTLNFTIKPASDIKDMKNLLIYVTLNTNGFENDYHFAFSFFEELTYIVTHKAVYPLTKFSILDRDDCNGLCGGIIRSYGPIIIMNNCITVCQLRTTVKQRSVSITVCIFADKTLHVFDIYLPIQRYRRFRIDTRALYCSGQTYELCVGKGSTR
jgi:hypothetical protein